MSSTDKEKVNLPQADVNKVVLGSADGFLAFGLGSGLSPFAPGTMGTLVAIPFIFPLRGLGVTGFWLALILLFVFGVWLCGRVSQKLGMHDHGGIVWDEWVGFWLTAAFIPLTWPWLLAAFALFRIFDILKPWPIRQLDKKVEGGFGIMIDDVVAALFAMLILALAQQFL